MVGEDKQGVGALPSDRAVVNGAGQAVSALRASVPSADMWAYAAAINKALCQLWPKDTHMETSGRGLHVECTITTVIEAEAVCAGIRHLSKRMTSHRPMIRGDIFPPLLEPTWREKINAMFGD